MVSWLHEISEVLDRAESPVRIFFRDDDAGWANDRLMILLDTFANADMPIDLAVIPNSLDRALAGELRGRRQQNPAILGLHQHGYSHSNHESVGRKCEFGPSRTKTQQGDDIAKGQAILQAHLDDAFDLFFTPPWNRCTQDTVVCLEELGFQALSRDLTATPYDSTRLEHIPVHIDWSKYIKNASDPLIQLGRTIAARIAEHELTGIMLHHADMASEHMNALAEFLSLLSGHRNVRGILLRHTLD